MPYRTSAQTQKRKDANKAAILRAASRCFARHGYAGASVTGIAGEADLSVGSFYFYFKNKEELFLLLYDEMDRLLNAVSGVALGKAGMGVAEGFCRSKTAELWAYGKFSGLARAMMVEAAGFSPVFAGKRAAILESCNRRIQRIFAALKSGGLLAVDDINTAVLLCNGTMYYIILDWLQRGCPGNLLDYTHPLSVYNLNAFQLDYEESAVKGYAETMIAELDSGFDLAGFVL